MTKTTPVDQIRIEAIKSLYAVAGATDAALETARGYATGAQKRTVARSERLTSFIGERRLPELDLRDFDFKGAQADLESWLGDVQKRLTSVELPKVEVSPSSLKGLNADQVRETVNKSVTDLVREARSAQDRVEALVADLQKDAQALPTKVQAQLTEALSDLVSVYGDLASRGERLVGQIRKDGLRKVATAKLGEPVQIVADTVDDVVTDVTDVIEAKAGQKSGRPSASKAARTTGAKPAAKKAPAKRTTAKKAPAKATAKKATAKNATAKKATATKAPAKTTTAKKA